MDDNFLTVQQAAIELDVTDGAIRLALSQGRLPFTEKYGRKLLARTDVEAYKQRTQPDGVKRIGRPRSLQLSCHTQKHDQEGLGQQLDGD